MLLEISYTTKVPSNVNKPWDGSTFHRWKLGWYSEPQTTSCWSKCIRPNPVLPESANWRCPIEKCRLYCSITSMIWVNEKKSYLVVVGQFWLQSLVDEMPSRWNALVGEFSHRLKKRVRWNAINAKKKSFSKVFPFFIDVWCCCCCYCYFCCCYCCCLLMLLPPLF